MDEFQEIRIIKDKIGISKKSNKDIGISPIPSNKTPVFGSNAKPALAPSTATPINLGGSKKKKKKPIEELLEIESKKS